MRQINLFSPQIIVPNLTGHTISFTGPFTGSGSWVKILKLHNPLQLQMKFLTHYFIVNPLQIKNI